jgi:signal transduction histidine kinase
MRNKLEWLIWKEKSKNSERISAEKTLINNIKHSIAQGLGIGGITTLIDLISMAAKQDGDHVDMPHHMFHQLVQTGDVIREWFDSLESITKAFGACYDSKPLESEGLCRIVKSSLEEVEKLRKIKNQNIFCETPPSVAVLAEEKGLALCVRELLTNAFKYSPEGSNIHITSYRTGNSVSLVVLNDVEFSTGRNTGVPREMENAVFEPFFRIHNTYDERFRSEELGMGIGLTVVQNAVNQFGGSVYVYEITDHASGLVPRRRVAAELILRTSQEASIADRTVSMRSVTR